MRKIEISITEEQYQKLISEIQKMTETNLQEETFSGYSLELNVVEGGWSWLDLKMNSVVELGDVSWEIIK